jgi:outer membrane protein assembly factor BamB
MLRSLTLALAALAAVPTVLVADDWPQWLGPRRDGVWREAGLVEKFPAGGPKVIWRKPVSEGYAGPAVADGKVFVTDRLRGKGIDNPENSFDNQAKTAGVERVFCLDQKTGDQLWKYEYECVYQVSYGAGPRTTPAVSGDKVYTLGTMGDLVCLTVKDGKPVWKKNLASTYGIPTPMWGFAGQPLVDGNHLICLVGGEGSTVVCFDKDTGKELWKQLSSSEPGYAPPMIYTLGGKRQLILWHADSVNGLDPETGKVYWTQPFGSEPAKVGKEKVKKVKAGMAIPTPRLLPDNRLYLTCFYNGSLMVQLDKDAPKVLWERTKRVVDPQPEETEQLHCVMSTPVYRDGYIYGVDSYGELRCLDAKTGERKWETFDATGGKSTRWGNAFIVQLGDGSDRYILFNELGDLILARLTPQKYEEISKAHILEPTNKMAAGFGGKDRVIVWSHPAFAGRCVFARNDKEIICVSLAK